MKNSLIKRMYVILIITVLAVSISVYSIAYVMTQDAKMLEIRERAIGVKDYILDNLTKADFVSITENIYSDSEANHSVQEALDSLRGVGNLARLYIAWKDESGEIVTTISVAGGGRATYLPTGRLEADLRRSLEEGEAVFGSGIYRTEDVGSVYTIFWPVSGDDELLLGVVCMEFDVNSIQEARTRAAIYSLALSGALCVLIFVIAYLSMNRATEPYFRKLAYTDFLTGYENRMAFEHRLRVCGDLAEQGRSVTLIIFDVNNLKTINDVQGHEAGDAYLKNTADLIFDNLFGYGALYRIGGDEFASIIIDRDEKEIERVMNALKMEQRMAYKTQEFSCACGAATFTKGIDNTMRDVLGRADVAMYAEKKRQKGLA